MTLILPFQVQFSQELERAKYVIVSGAHTAYSGQLSPAEQRTEVKKQLSPPHHARLSPFVLT